VVTLPFHPIGYVHSDLRDEAAAPRQASEAAGVDAHVVLDPAFADGLLGLDAYRWIWLLTWLDRGPEGQAPLQLVPSGTGTGDRLQGVFASRAPARPNPIGLSLVELLGVDGTTLRLGGADLLDGTPVLDVKPWFEDCDAPPGPAGR
jgi:tRNA-Thr(GGU) m(6)t(6)A37 methyltransferase TsaA